MKVRPWAVAIVFLKLAFSAPVLGAGEGESSRSLSVDLDRDGKAEQISWSKIFETEDDGEFFQVRVISEDGRILWQSPKLAEADNPLVFGNWHFGYSLPELAADIDGDGAIELVAPAPQSDVSPTAFRILRWQRDRFVPVRTAILLETPSGSGHFPWSHTEQWQGSWISSFKAINPDGSLRVEVFDYRDQATPRSGLANVMVTPKGYRVRDWTTPLKALSDSPAGQTPGNDTKAVVYRARLSGGDHFNSKGTRLDSVSDILRQDRANLSRGKGDPEDSSDPLFGTAAGREGMAQREPLAIGVRESVWRAAIVNGTPLVEVEVTPTTLRVKIVAQ